MRLTKFNEETGQYEYIEKAKTLDEYRAQRKAAIQKLGEYEDGDKITTRDDRLGSTAFLTQEEAEKALERSENGKS